MIADSTDMEIDLRNYELTLTDICVINNPTKPYSVVLNKNEVAREQQP